jgi:serine/threonine protein kinase
MDAVSSGHPTRHVLSSFGLGKLDGRLAATVQQHLERCLDCQKQIAEMSADSFLGCVRDAQNKDRTCISARLKSLAGESAPEPPQAHTLPPSLADHEDYEVIRELGRGGMGVVYLVENKLMGRKEVLKVVGAHLINRPGVADRFLREIRSAARLHHTNIVTAYTALRFGESLALAMEYVNGFDLSQLVKAKGPLSVPQACNFVYQAAQGLQHALEHGMVHRDIKPSNLMLARVGKKPVVKVLDFGLAKVTSEGQGDSGLTREGQMLGTPDFIAPEQIRDAQSADIRADVYSLGCTLYYLLAGRPPFVGDHVWDIYQAHYSMDANPLNLVRPEVPAELAAITAKMMAKELHRRFQEPTDVAQALSPFFKPAVSPSPGLYAGVLRVDSEESPAGGSGVSASSVLPASLCDSETSAARRSSKRNDDVVPWKSLIAIKEGEPLVNAAKRRPAKPTSAPAEAPVGRPPWRKSALAAVALFLGLLAVWSVVLTVKTSPLARMDATENSHAQPTEPENVTHSADSRDGIAHRYPRQVVLRSKVERRGLVISGSWMSQGDELVQTSPGYQISEIVFGDPNWSNYDLSFEVKKDTEGWGDMGGRRFTTLFHWSDIHSKCWYSGYNDAHEIASEVDGNWSRDWELRPGNWVGAKGELQDGKWYPVSIRVRGKAVKCFFNDNLMFDDVHPSLSQGRIGFGSADAQMRFRRIKVIDPDGTVLFEGLPNMGE